MVRQIRKQLTKLRALDIKKRDDGLSHAEQRLWIQYYAGVLKLYDPGHARLVEERDHVRVPIDIQVRYQIENKNYNVQSKDLCVAGIGVPYNADVRVDDVASLAFQIVTPRYFFLQDEHCLNFEGVVKWSSAEENRTGLEFLAVNPEMQAVLHRAVFCSIHGQIKLARKWI